MKSNPTKYKTDLRQRCYQFSINIIALTDNLPKKSSAWVITDQIIRSSASIGANLMEAKASSSRLEYKRFFEISLKSADETKYWLQLLEGTKLVTPEKIRPLMDEVTELSNMIAVGVMNLKNDKTS